MRRNQHPGCLGRPNQSLHSGVCTTRSALPSAIPLPTMYVRADCLNFCFCYFHCACNVRHVDLGPPRISFRQRRCRQVPGGFARRKSNRAAMLRPARPCWALVTLLQFYTDYIGGFVIPRRHEQGRPVSRRQDDLQGPKLSGRAPRQTRICANLHLPSVPPEFAISLREMPGTASEQDFTRIRSA